MPAITTDTLLAEQRQQREAWKEHEAYLQKMDDYEREVWGAQTEEDNEEETEEEEESSDDNGYRRRGKGKKRRRNGKGPATKRSMPWFNRAV